MQRQLSEIATLLGAELEGDPSLLISGIRGLENAGPSELSFVTDSRYWAAAEASRAGALLVSKDYRVDSDRALLRVKDPYASFLQLIPHYHADPGRRAPGVAASAVVHASAILGERVSIGDHCVVEEGAAIGESTVLWPGAYVGPGVKLGADCVIYPQVSLLRDVELGDGCIVHSGTVIGSDGFGYVHTGTEHKKIPHLGTVRIGHQVEIGANVCIDRGTLGSTAIGNGVKIDNLVHIAHNVTIGDQALIVAQVGISGSSKVGAGAVLGGQAGVVGHLEIGPGAKVGAQAGVTKSVPAHTVVSGYPAMEHGRAKRLNGYVRRLPELAARLKALEAKLKELGSSETTDTKRERIS